MKVEEKPLGFIETVKAFWKGTDGGAVPVALAATMCGISRERVYQLIKKELEKEGTGLRACKWNNKVLDIFYPLEEKGIDIDWCIDFVEDENWNSKWEQNFSPVFIGNSCVIRSDFHKKTNINHEIICLLYTSPSPRD